MRFFLTTVATRAWVFGGITFNFEPTSLRGGLWQGVLAVEEPAASVLAASGSNQIDEISEDLYNSEKKKDSEVLQSSVRSIPSPTGNPLVQAAAAAAGRLIPPLPNSEPAIVPSEMLETTDRNPPPDPLLEEVTPKRQE